MNLNKEWKAIEESKIDQLVDNLIIERNDLDRKIHIFNVYNFAKSLQQCIDNGDLFFEDEIKKIQLSLSDDDHEILLRFIEKDGTTCMRSLPSNQGHNANISYMYNCFRKISHSDKLTVFISEEILVNNKIIFNFQTNVEENVIDALLSSTLKAIFYASKMSYDLNSTKESNHTNKFKV